MCLIAWFKHVLAYKEHALGLWCGKIINVFYFKTIREMERNLSLAGVTLMSLEVLTTRRFHVDYK